jgi:O-antigen/teichoic acid export membrane protein
MTFPLLTIPSTIISSLATALVPELSVLKDAENLTRVRSQIKKSIEFTIFINFIFIPVFIAMGAGIGEFLYAEVNAGLYLAKSAWVMVPLSLSQITAATLNSLNAENQAMRNYFTGSIALFACVWFLPAVAGADAAAIGLGSAMTIASALNIMSIRKLTKWQSPPSVLKCIFTYISISIPAIVIGFFAYELFGLFVAGILSCLSFLIMAFTFCNLSIIKSC